MKAVTTATAKQLKRGTYRLLCGICRRTLGYTPASEADFIIRESRMGDYYNTPDLDFRDAFDTVGKWYVSHEHGFRWDSENDCYRVMDPNKRRRHKTPARLDRTVHHSWDLWPYGRMDYEEVARESGYDLDFGRTPIGQFPALPAVIVCPRCSAPNRVNPPEDGPSPYTW